MFFLLSFLLSSRAGTCALPILPSSFPEASNQDLIFDVTTTASTGACAGRSLWDILWSCLATTFACTWVSVHPNIPFLRERKISTRRWRLYLMVVSLIAPEIMILWAFKQLQGALVILETVNQAIDKIALDKGKTANDRLDNVGEKTTTNAKPQTEETKTKRKNSKTLKTDDIQRWTLTHAHYLQMGGFRLQCLPEDNAVIRSTFGRKIPVSYSGQEQTIWELPLSFETMKTLFNKGLIDLPFTPLDEIEDKCGRDALSKTIAILQLAWFIIQIIARVHQNLAVTELELTTAALASLNFAMYISWWSKPTDIVCPTTIRSKELEKKIRIWRLGAPLPPYSPPDRVISVSSDASPHPPDCTQCANYHVIHSSSGAGAVGGAQIGDKKTVNLVIHYCTEFGTALAGLAKAILYSPVTIVRSVYNAIRGFGERIHQIWARAYMSHRDSHSSSLRGKIGRTLYLLWQAVTHIFLALIYYPILAILGSGRRLQLRKIKDVTGGTDEASRSEDATKLGARSESFFKKKGDLLTAEVVESMTTVQLIFNKYALRFVMDMVFFCEDVASAPFSCLSAFAGAIFGMIHCLAWNFEFPSHAEQVLWRVSSSIISGLCIFITIAALGYIIFKPPNRPDKPKGDRDDDARNPADGDESHSFNITEVACSILAMCFVLTRLSLITLSFMGLRALPASAFDAVQWSGFIPHI